MCSSFLFQAEEGIRDGHVTGVQTCALPIWQAAQVVVPAADGSMGILPQMQPTLAVLERGLVRIIDESGQATERSVVGGFVSVDTDVVTIAVDRQSTRLNSSHVAISNAVFCLQKKTMGRPP